MSEGVTMSKKEVRIERLSRGFKVTVMQDFSAETYACMTVMDVHELVDKEFPS